MENTGRLNNPALKWAMQITCKLINLALKGVISTALKYSYAFLNLALKCPAPGVLMLCNAVPPPPPPKSLVVYILYSVLKVSKWHDVLILISIIVIINYVLYQSYVGTRRI